MLQIQCLESKTKETNTILSRFAIGPLKKGQGLTIGNALRRVLLSNLEGTAITGIKIPNIAHEFSTIPDVREDVLEIFLNLKQIVLKSKKQHWLFSKYDLVEVGRFLDHSAFLAL